MKSRPLFTPRLILLLSVAAATMPDLARAQSTVAPPEPAKPAVDADGVTILTPFEVTSTRDRGYQATDTLAGTRIRTELADIGASIQVITKEFLTDIGATDNLTLLQYTTSAEVGGTHSTYTGSGNSQSIGEGFENPSGNTRVRGLSAADNTRDFFVSDIPWDGFNVDRLDIQRGANSILFGLGKPAGIVNASLNGAEFRNRGTVELRTGSYGSFRSSLDLNHKLIDNQLAIRVAALRDNEKFRQKPAFENDQRLYGAVRYDPKLFKNRALRTSIRVKFEDGEINANRPRNLPPNDNLSPFFQPLRDPVNNPWGGLNRGTFHAFYALNGENIAGDGRGQATGTDPDFNAWVSGNSLIQQQQPFFMIDGTTGQPYRAYGGFLNRAVRTATGALAGGASGIAAIPNSFPFISIGSPQGYANAVRLDGYQYGQYRQWSLRDPSVFDYRNTLIDGPNKWERSKWDAYNIDISQTAFNDRVGVNLTYDRQTYRTGSESLFGFAPTLNVDLTGVFQDFSVNPNAGRPFISGGGGGRWTKTKREVGRASVFAELRTRDFLPEGFLTRLLGRHRFNGVYSDDEYFTETRGYRQFSAALSWYEHYIGPAGRDSAFDARAPTSIIYLGPTLLGRNAAAGANLPGVKTSVLPNDAPIYHFLSEWNSTVPFGAAYDKRNDPVWGQFPSTGNYTQSGNPANYVGWNSNFTLDLSRAADGAIDENSTSAVQTFRKTESWAGSWQSFWWKDALVGTLGWRYDAVKSKNVQANRVASNRNLLNLSPDVYRLPDKFDPAITIKDHSLSWGAVLHVNRLFKADRLPLNVSLAYNNSSNFEVTTRRVDLYGDPLAAPAGDTKDYSIRLATRDNKYSFRVTKYGATVRNATSSGFDTSTVGGILASGIAWANVFEYDLGLYELSSAGQTGGRNTYAPGPGETQEDATRREMAAIASWRELQQKVNPRIYEAWGMDPSRIYQYTTRAPANFTILEDATAKGSEFEFVANPTSGWRISANASRTESMSTNVGGSALIDYVNVISHYMNNTPAGDLRQFSGGPTATTFRGTWNNGFMVRWALKKLQEGATQPEIRQWRYSVTNNYTFRSGRLKDLGVGASYRWEDKVGIGYPVVPPPAGSTLAGIYDLTRPYYGPSEDFVDAWISYRRKITEKIGWKVQLNVRNIFAEGGLIPVTVQPDGVSWGQGRIKPAREWFLTNTITF